MIRPATTEDLDALVALEERCFEADRLDKAALRHALNSQVMLCLVDEHEDVVRGHLLLRVRPRTGEARVLSLAVQPDQRRRGVANALLEAAEQAVRDGGFAELVLELREDNAAALALYQSRGYRQTGTLLAFYHDKSDARRLAKPLTQETGV